jgi:formylglycine-generating enzyme required for sulfatase activity
MILFPKKVRDPRPAAMPVKKIAIRIIAQILIFLLAHGPIVYGYPQYVIDDGIKENFAAALAEYKSGLAEEAAAKLKNSLSLMEEGEPVLKAKIYLLLGACCEKLKQEAQAKYYFSELKEMLDQRAIAQAPAIEGIDPVSFPTYREIFDGDTYFSFKKPVLVSEVIKNNILHAPRKSVEQKEKEKKKRKFPWLIAIGAVVITGTAVVLLLSARKKKPNPLFPEIDWATIPEGEFFMGDNFAEGDADEQPVHPVYLDEYRISKYEITYAQYDFFCAETNREKPSDVIIWGSFDRRGSLPVVSISWNDAAAFCVWLSRRTGEKIYLPTEAQWEKAARGELQYRYPWGNSEPTCSIANYFGCGDDEDWYSHLAHVGLHRGGISPYGVYDMAGNAWEWCRDWYGESYYSVSTKNTNNPPGPTAGSYRVIRGGGVDSKIDDIRAAARSSHPPGYGRVELGFRVVVEK